MKLGDIIWFFVLSIIVVFILGSEKIAFLSDHGLTFRALTANYPYIMGFFKVAILATMGELLAIRIATSDWKKPNGMLMKSFVWGLLGLGFVIAFPLFAGGVKALMTAHLMPDFGNNIFMTALLTSAFMNLVFGPTFMCGHRITDTYIDLAGGKISNLSKVSLAQVTGTIDWNGLIGFVLVKTIPIFWIPAHTITFCIPPEYRVVMAAMLSICLGVILSYAKRKQATK